MTGPVVDARPVVAAVEAAIADQGVAVGDGEKPAVGSGLPYIVHWMNAGTVGNRSLKSRDGLSLLAPFQVYGFDPDAVRWAVRLLRTGIQGLHLTVVDGRTVHVLTPSDPPPMSRDDDADPPIWMQYEEFRLRLS